MADWHMADWRGFIPSSPQGWAMMGKSVAPSTNSAFADEQPKPNTSDKAPESDK